MNPTKARISKIAKTIVIYSVLTVFFRLFLFFLLRRTKKTSESIKTIVIYSVIAVFFGFSGFFGFGGSELDGLATLHNY